MELQIAFDYVDPGSYLTWAILDRMGVGGEEPVQWTPLELCPAPRPLLDPEEEGWRAMTAALLEFAESEGIPMESPSFLPRTRKAHELAFMAAEKGCFPEVHRALFRSHFLEGGDIGRVDTLVRVGVTAGMDRGEVHTVLGVDRFLPAVDAAREACRTLRVRGVPTMILGNDRLEGFQGEPPLRAFLGR